MRTAGDGRNNVAFAAYQRERERDPAAIGVLRDLAADDYLLCVGAQSEFTSPKVRLNHALAIGVLRALP